MAIAYAAVTESGTFMLDDGGVCRWAVAGRNPDGSKSVVPDRIVGGQFVATLDMQSEQGLAALPKVGAPMLFAVVDPSGHISLVRTARLVRWEDKRGEEVELDPADATTPAPNSSARALPMPLTRPPSFHARLPPSSPPRRQSPLPLPTPPARMRSDVAPKIPPARASVRNNFAPPPAPVKRGALAIGPMASAMRASAARRG